MFLRFTTRTHNTLHVCSGILKFLAFLTMKKPLLFSTNIFYFADFISLSYACGPVLMGSEHCRTSKMSTQCTARLHNRLVCRHYIDHVINDEHNIIIIVVLAKHEIAPWWWFLREPKHVGAIVRILIIFNIPTIL